MKIIKIIGIVIPLVILAIAIPVFVTSLSQSISLGQDKENSKPVFVSMFQQILDHCTASGINDPNCKDSVQRVQKECSFYDNPPICSDSRINQILNS